ncbi:NADH-quinone oxidoreductase subunit NuoG [Anaerolineales bacterium HSG24]|nr:NADH-quinone oxidoreductase subunit NuoG [Anaerolineales bacterium HSG24]
MSDQVTLTIDGKTVTVPKGTLIVEAAKQIEQEIPVFCYHDKLNSVGVCRMCLVEVGTPMFDRATREPVLDENGAQKIGFFPKPMTACTMPVSEGMVVKVDSGVAHDDRKAVLEFLLTSHPLDCPVCDKGGECPLQDLTIRYGPDVSRFNHEGKQHFPKKYPLGDLIVLDMERCVLCTRCIRFQSEIAHDPVLAIENRGRNAHVVSYSDPQFDSHYSGNTADVCPVGALTTKDFRFGARSWEMQNVPSICNHCAVGCNTVLGTRKGGSGKGQLKRIMPRQNETVNELWICDKGRFGHHFNGSPNRLTTPLIRQDGQLVASTWADVLPLIGEKISSLKSDHGPTALGGIAGARLSNEDLYLFQKLFRQIIGSNNIDHRVGLNANFEDTTAYTVGVGVGTDLSQVGKGSTILVIGSDLDQEAPVLYLRVAGASVKRGAHVINIGGRRTKLDAQAQTSAYYRYGTSPHLVLGILASVVAQGLVDQEWVDRHTTGFSEITKLLQDFAPDKVADITGVATPEIEAIAKSYAEAENGIILFGHEAGNDPALGAAIEALAAVTGHAGKPNNGVIAILPHANSRGAADMGVVPDRLLGYLPLEGEAGLSAEQMLSGTSSIKGMIIAGADPVSENDSYRQALEDLDFLVVQDLFLTETAQLADVVLPAKAVAERDGTFTNLERRVQAFDVGIDSPLLAWSDWLILAAIAGQLGANWSYASADGVMKEITEQVSLYQGMSFENLVTPVSLDRQTDHYIYEGMSFTTDVRDGLQWATVAESEQQKITLRLIAPQSCTSSDEMTLVTPRMLYDSGRLLAETELLQGHIFQSKALLSSLDAKKLELNSGDTVTVSRNGTAVNLPIQISRMLNEGMILIPRNIEGRPAEKLVGASEMHTSIQIKKS